jgi:hypothetical protein
VHRTLLCMYVCMYVCIRTYIYIYISFHSLCIERAALINPRVEKSRLVSSLISGAHFTCFTGTTAQSTDATARGISLISEAVDMRACRMLFLFIYLLVQQRKVLTQLRWTVGL